MTEFSYQDLDLWDKSYCNGKSKVDTSEMSPRSPPKIVNIKQYNIPRGMAKISAVVKILKTAGMVIAMISPFSSLLWPCKHCSNHPGDSGLPPELRWSMVNNGLSSRWVGLLCSVCQLPWPGGPATAQPPAHKAPEMYQSALRGQRGPPAAHGLPQT